MDEAKYRRNVANTFVDDRFDCGAGSSRVDRW
jgi:hypothetical protein